MELILREKAVVTAVYCSVSCARGSAGTADDIAIIIMTGPLRAVSSNAQRCALGVR
jgi:hypothetical protein